MGQITPMELPKIHSDDWAIKTQKQSVSVGDCVYDATDGVIYRITNENRLIFQLKPMNSNDEWRLDKDELQSNLHVDFFPVVAKA